MNKEARIDILCKSLANRNPDIRLKVVESLGCLLAGVKRSPKELVKKLQDPNELIRIEVAEALGAIGDPKVLPKLWMAIGDRSPLVRSYIASAIGVLGSSKDIKKLQGRVQQEKTPTAKLGYYQALFCLGERDVFWTLLSFLEHEDYRLRCAAGDTLCASIADSSNADIILAVLIKVLKDEKTVAAKSTFQECIRTIKKRFKRKVNCL